MKRNFSKRQEQIVEITMNIIREKGLVSATTRNIAGKLNIKEPSLYRHFTNKEAIFEGMCATVEGFYTDMAEEMAGKSGSTMEQIEAAYEIRSRIFGENPDLACVLLNAEIVFQAYPPLLQRMHDVRKSDYEALLKAVKKGQSAGEIRKDMRAESIASFIGGSFAAIVNGYWKRYDNVADETRKVWKDLKKAIAV